MFIKNNKVSFLKKSYSRFGKEFILTSLGQALYLLQNIIQNKVFTSFFETAVYGKWSLILSAYTLVSMIPFSAIDQGVYKVAHKCKEEKKEQYLYSLIAFGYFLGFLLYSIIFFIMHLFQGNEYFAHGYGILFAIYAFSEIIKNTFLLLDNAFRNRKRVFIIRLFGVVSRTILYFICIYLDIFTIKTVLMILILTNAIILLFENEYVKKITFKLDKKSCKEIAYNIIKFSAPLMTWAIFGWMQNMISRWYLDVFLDLEAVAMYSVLTTLSYFVPNAAYTIINAYVMPIVFEKNKDFNRKKLLKFIGIVLIPLAFYLVLVIFFGRYLVLVFSHGKYLDILNYLPFTTCSAIIYVVAMLSTVEIYRRGETKKLLFSTIIPGLFMATVGYFLIYYFGFSGAVINYMCGHIIYMILTFLVVFNKKNISKN